MPNVTMIPATINKQTAMPINTTRKRKVAGYARVSSDHEEQASSYEAQVDYYTSYIKAVTTGSLPVYIQMKASPPQIQKREKASSL